MHSFILKHFFISLVFDFYFINSLLLTLVFMRLICNSCSFWNSFYFCNCLMVFFCFFFFFFFLSLSVHLYFWFNDFISLCYLRDFFFVFSDFFEGIKKFMSKNSFRTWDKFSSIYFFYFLFMFHYVQILCWIYSDFYLSLDFFANHCAI